MHEPIRPIKLCIFQVLRILLRTDLNAYPSHMMRMPVVEPPPHSAQPSSSGTCVGIHRVREYRLSAIVRDAERGSSVCVQASKGVGRSGRDGGMEAAKDSTQLHACWSKPRLLTHHVLNSLFLGLDRNA